jgi:ligand-binding sensor domain-containing protein/signal transduction histidine kinase
VRPRIARQIIPRMFVALAVLSILFSPNFTTPALAQTGTVRFESLTTEEGLSQSTVHTILQDQQGFMWFGTEEGLNKYDGYQFTVYKHDSDDSKTLVDNLIQTIAQDSQGGIWIGTSSGLDRFDPKTGTFLHYPQDLAGGSDLSGQSISAILQDRSGTLWVGTAGGGLAAVDLAAHHSVLFQHSSEGPQSLSGNSIEAIYEDRTGELWVGTDNGLDHFDRASGKFSPSFSQAVPGSAFIGNAAVYTLAEDGGGAVWIGTSAGLYKWDRDANHLSVYRHDPEDPVSLSDDAVTRILEDTRGALWIGTRTGLDLFDPTHNSFISYVHDPNDPYSLASNSVRSIYEDRSGVLWIGTSGGLNKYARSTQKFDLFQHTPGLSNTLSDNNIWAIDEDHLGNLWVGTFFAGLDRLNPTTGAVTVYQNNPSDPTSLSSNEVRALLEDHAGNLWIGMERGGLARFDPETGTFIAYQHNDAEPGSLSNNDVFSIFEDRAERLWIGTQRGGLNRFDPASGTFIHYQYDANDPKSLSDNQVRAIQEDHNGVLWIATFGGVDLWDGKSNHFTVYRHDPKDASSLSSDEVSCIFEDQEGNVWVGTFGGGLNRFDRATRSFTHYTEKNGLPDDTVYGILADPGGDLWLSTNKGLARFDPLTQVFRNYDVSDGLQGDQFNPGASFQGKDGQMFFGGTQGLNAFLPQQVKDNLIPPPVVITAVKKYNQTIQTNPAPNAIIPLSYRDNFISFEFAALDYNTPEKNQYAYMLEGIDKDWISAGTRRYASYTNLQGGDYIFRVKASNNDGIWNEQATTLFIHITPPFWQTWWFIGIIGLVAVAGSIGGYRLRVRDIQARNRELSKRVEQRTHELATLNTISEVVNRSLDLTEILNAALDKTIEIMRMDGGLAFRANQPVEGASDAPSSTLLTYRGVSDEYANTIARSLPVQDTMHEKDFLAGQPIVNQPAIHPIPISQVQEANEREGIQMGINVPLLVKGRLVGGLSLAARRKRIITPEELSLLAAIGQQVGMAVENARLYEQAEQTAATIERNRLARELHDSVTQSLYSVTLYAEAAAEQVASGEKETALDHLHELRDTAQEALREMRLLIFELRRPTLEKSGLAGALQARLDAVETRGGLHSEMEVIGIEQLPLPVQAELYNIAQEALNNTLKHAHAGLVRIRLQFEDGGAELEVSDDGVGFEPASDRLSGGFGISGMKERAQKIGGTLLIESTPGRGTKVIVRVPASSSGRVDHTGTGPAV